MLPFVWSLRLAGEQCSVTMRCGTESISFAAGRSAWDWDLLLQCLSNKSVCDWDCMNSFHLLDHQFASQRGDTELRSIAYLCMRWKETPNSAPRNASAPPVLWLQSRCSRPWQRRQLWDADGAAPVRAGNVPWDSGEGCFGPVRTALTLEPEETESEKDLSLR